MDEEKVTEQMTVLVVEPGYAPYEKTIPHELHAMQEIVGGLITAIYPYEEPVGIVANDEGLLLGMDFNRTVEGGYGGLVGPFFVCGLTDESFCSLPPDQIDVKTTTLSDEAKAELDKLLEETKGEIR